MNLMNSLSEKWKNVNHPFLIYKDKELRFSDVINQSYIDLKGIQKGDVVAIIGDFNPVSISTLIRLIDIGAILVPLTNQTKQEHDYFFDSALVDIIIENNTVKRRVNNKNHQLIDNLRLLGHPGLVLFSTGTTGRPKAILHDLTFFIKRFYTPRPTFKTINFLLFDHIGGINTLFHTLFNKGVVVIPESRKINSIIEVCNNHNVELLPTTPTFLRMMLMSGVVPNKIPKSLKLITYGTELMDQPTLDKLCLLLPEVDFRQTFGMSELGIVRVKSEAKNSLFMKIGGEGVETRVVKNVLQIRSSSRMIGYLNAPSPFDAEGWYNTNDVVEVKNQYYKITGRIGDVINVGGLKFMPSEVERVALIYPNISLVKVVPKKNPLTGQHVELLIQLQDKKKFDKEEFKHFLKEKLPAHMLPKRIKIEDIKIGHRYKKY